MELDIVGVSKTKKGEEYLELSVTVEKTNLKDYAVTDATFDEDGAPSNKQRHFFKFPKKEVTKGQRIILFTQSMTQAQGTVDGSIVYFAWNLNHDVWNDTGDTATIIKIEEAKSKKVN